MIKFKLTLILTEFHYRASKLLYCNQGWQYGTVRSEFAYYVPRTLNRTVPAYRTSVQVLKRTVPTYRIGTITKKAYRTSVLYFSAKIEAYRTYVTYLTAILALNYSQL